MESDPSRKNLTWWQRNALTVIVVIMGGLFALVIAVQMLRS